MEQSQSQARDKWQYYAEIKKQLDMREIEANSSGTYAKVWKEVLPYMKFCIRSGYINNDNMYAMLLDKNLAEAWYKRGV